MSTVKRFIAGAVCPRCAQMDSVRMYRDEEREYRECVKCGFEDSLRLDGRPEPEELETRVSGERSDKAPGSSDSEREQVQVINFDTGLNRRDH
ncbi:YheV family putative zinc ribbon protein [Marinobacterium sp. YM272]|uniref:YheV family putative zinc ribbon protein n=1 Tax=Marinobacterium sp. YM272 TaxID=3421654 RepID=UPI003D7F5075